MTTPNPTPPHPEAARRVAVVFGTRPEAVKLCPVILALRRTPGLDPLVCVTGQHREMLDQVLEVFEIRPDVDLNLMRANQTLAGLTARAVEAVDGFLEAQRPNLVLVQGDTTTVFAAALAAFYRRVPVGHVEAGLRTGDKWAPFPEEINRTLVTRLADHHFAPTPGAAENLRRDSVPDDRIHITGNTVVDALLATVEAAQRLRPKIPGLDPEVLDRADENPIVLITGHRRESFGPGFEAICRAIAALARRYPDARFVYPVHLNPNVRRPVFATLSGLDNVFLIEPLGYLAFVSLMQASRLILTDSGGIQEEAPSLRKPVLVMRDATERPEGVQAGAVRLVGADSARIEAEVGRLLDDERACAAMARAVNPYGDGQAAERIARLCADILNA